MNILFARLRRAELLVTRGCRWRSSSRARTASRPARPTRTSSWSPTSRCTRPTVLALLHYNFVFPSPLFRGISLFLLCVYTYGGLSFAAEESYAGGYFVECPRGGYGSKIRVDSIMPDVALADISDTSTKVFESISCLRFTEYRSLRHGV